MYQMLFPAAPVPEEDQTEALVLLIQDQYSSQALELCHTAISTPNSTPSASDLRSYKLVAITYFFQVSRLNDGEKLCR